MGNGSEHQGNGFSRLVPRTAVSGLVLLGILIFLQLHDDRSAAASAASDDVAMITAHVSRIAKIGIPGPVACVAEESFPVVIGKSEDYEYPVVAATRYGKGRVIAFGHGGYLSEEAAVQDDTRRLLANAAKWAARTPSVGKPKPVVGLIGNESLAKTLAKAGFQVKPLQMDQWMGVAEGVDLLVVSDNEALTSAGAEEALAAYVRNGGGLLTAGLAWGWMQVASDADFCRDHRLNRVLAPMGLAFVDGYIEEIVSPSQSADADSLLRASAFEALEFLELRRLESGGQEGEVSDLADIQASIVIASAYRWLPDGPSAFRDRVRVLMAEIPRPVVPTLEEPLDQKSPLTRLALVVDHLDALHGVPGKSGRSETAEDFPGTPDKAARRVVEEIDIDLSVPGWASTGLWVVAGEPVDIELPENCSGDGFGVRIGCHTDILWSSDEWLRHPEISRRFPTKKGRNHFSSPHGGLLYIEVPRSPDNKGGGQARIRVSGGVVEAPYFVLGKTDAATWKKRRNAPAPWAELQCDRIILTVRSEDARRIDDPEKLMEFWRTVIGYYAELGARPLDIQPQRFVPDRQISDGYLHSGYPIMGQIEHSSDLVNLERLSGKGKDGDSGNWGFWHELGHNFQRDEWTFAPMDEVTCNLFTLFVEEKTLGTAPKNHPWLSEAFKQVPAYLAHPDIELLQENPALALCFYVELQKAFGWEAFKKAFASYAADAEEEAAETDEAKRDKWLVRMSQATGRNLGPFFDTWGVPVSELARRKVASLPAWEAPSLGLQQK